MFSFMGYGGQENLKLKQIIDKFEENKDKITLDIINNVFDVLIKYFIENESSVLQTSKSLPLNIEDHKQIYDRIIKVIADIRGEKGGKNMFKHEPTICNHNFFKFFLTSLIGVNYHASEYYREILFEAPHITKKFNGFYTCECIFLNYDKMVNNIREYYTHDSNIIKELGPHMKTTKNIDKLIINIKKMQVLSLLNLCAVKRVEKYTTIKNIVETKLVPGENGQIIEKEVIPQSLIDVLNAKLEASSRINNDLAVTEIEEEFAMKPTEENIKKQNDNGNQQIINDKSEKKYGKRNMKKVPEIPKKLEQVPKSIEHNNSKPLVMGDAKYIPTLINLSKQIPSFHIIAQILGINTNVQTQIRLLDSEVTYESNQKNTNDITILSEYRNVLHNFITKINPIVSNDKKKSIVDFARIETLLLELLQLDMPNEDPIVSEVLNTTQKQEKFDALEKLIILVKTQIKNQAGGSKSYESKYLKYKAKYMQLKHN
jgi:hypothetical protein